MSPLERAIIKTISYFDIFDYPLTDWEIYQWLYTSHPNADGSKERNDYISIKKILLESEKLRQMLGRHHGLYYLKGRNKIINTRQKRYIINMKKIRKILTAVRVLSRLPYVRLIGICNNLAFLNSKKQGDFDIFIITAFGKLPLVRLLSVMVSLLFFKRPTNEKQEDTICLSFFIDRGKNRLENYALKGVDIYLIYWLATLQPVYMYDDSEYAMLRQNNQTLLGHLANHLARETNVLSVGRHKLFKNILEKFFDVLAPPFIISFMHTRQIKHLPKNIVKQINRTSSVVITPYIFKTHINDKRHEIKSQWEKRVSVFSTS